MNVVHHSTTEVHDKAKSLAVTAHSFAWVMRVSVLTAVILGFAYLMLLNSLATQGFALEELKAERLDIQKELEATEISLAIPISLYALQSSEQVQEMADIEDKRYVHVREGEVAMVQ